MDTPANGGVVVRTPHIHLCCRSYVYRAGRQRDPIFDDRSLRQLARETELVPCLPK